MKPQFPQNDDGEICKIRRAILTIEIVSGQFLRQHIGVRYYKIL